MEARFFIGKLQAKAATTELARNYVHNRTGELLWLSTDQLESVLCADESKTTSKDKGSVDVNVKLFLYLIKPRAVKACEAEKLQICAFLTSALDWGERSASRHS